MDPVCKNQRRQRDQECKGHDTHPQDTARCDQPAFILSAPFPEQAFPERDPVSDDPHRMIEPDRIPEQKI